MEHKPNDAKEEVKATTFFYSNFSAFLSPIQFLRAIFRPDITRSFFCFNIGISNVSNSTKNWQSCRLLFWRWIAEPEFSSLKALFWPVYTSTSNYENFYSSLCRSKTGVQRRRRFGILLSKFDWCSTQVEGRQLG